MKKLIIGNWKMFPNSALEAKKLFCVIKKTADKKKNIQTVICPPSLFIKDLASQATGSRCVVGAQNLFWEKEGPFTGEISAEMLKSIKVKYVIVGHSERRLMGETSEDIAKKVVASLRAGLNTVLCIGELERDSSGNFTKFLREEIQVALKFLNRPVFTRLIIAYEPIWAIGKKGGRAAEPEDVLEVSIFIRKVIADMFDKKTAMSVPILYGGSVDHKNTQVFFEKGEIQGLLVGRASLDPKKFEKIISIAEDI